MTREKPDSEIDPRDHHLGITQGLNKDGGHINSYLKDTHSQVSHIMQEHHGSTHRKKVQRVREEN